MLFVIEHRRPLHTEPQLSSAWIAPDGCSWRSMYFRSVCLAMPWLMQGAYDLGVTASFSAFGL